MGSTNSTPSSSNFSAPTDHDHPSATLSAAGGSSDSDWRAISNHAQTMPISRSHHAVASGSDQRRGGERVRGDKRGEPLVEGGGEGTWDSPPNIDLSLTTKSSIRKLDHIKTAIRQDPTVLEDSQWCACFRAYLLRAYASDLLGGPNHSVTDERRVKAAPKREALALQYFNFWSDLTDLMWCQPSAFRSLRVEAVLNKYLSRGTENPLPLSDSVRSSVLGEAGCGGTQESLDEARDEAFCYLSSEVLPLFVTSKSALGLPASLHRTKRVVLALDEPYKKITAYQNALMVLQRVQLSQAFIAFLKAKEAEDTITGTGRLSLLAQFGVEVLGYKSLLDMSALQRWRVDQQLKKASKGFLSTMGDDTLDRGRSATASATNSAALSSVESFGQSIRDSTIGDRLTGGLCDDEEGQGMLEWFQFMAAHDIFESHLRLGLPVRALLPQHVVQTLLSRLCGQNQEHCVANDLFDELLAYVLFNLSEHVAEFYMSPTYQKLSAEVEPPLASQEETQDQQGQWLFAFYQEVQELKTRSKERLNVCSRVTKLYLTYVKRGAPCELAVLAGAPRHKVAARLVKPGSLSDCTIYNDCQALALDALATKYTSGLSAFTRFRLADEEDEAPGSRSSASSTPGAKKGPSLSEVLEDPTGLIMLRRVAAAECMLTPLLFWLEAEKYRNLPRQDLLLIRSKALIRKYIHLETATYPLGLSDDMRDKILDLERRAIAGPALFIEAQMQVYAWMSHELLPRFFQTPLYQDLRLMHAVDQELDFFSPAFGVEAIFTSGRQSDSSTDSERRSSSGILRQSSLNDVIATATDSGRLRGMLTLPTALPYFKEFCRRKGATHQVLFWMDAENFKLNLPEQQAFGRLQARKLVHRYIREGASMKIEIDTKLQQTILKKALTPARTLFKEAQDEVFRIMVRDLLSAFLESPEFQAMEAAHAVAEATPWVALTRGISRLLTGYSEGGSRVSSFRLPSLHAGAGDGAASPEGGHSNSGRSNSGGWGQQHGGSFRDSFKSLFGLDDSRSSTVISGSTMPLVSRRSSLDDPAPPMVPKAGVAPTQPTGDHSQASSRGVHDAPANPVKQDDAQSPVPEKRSTEPPTLPMLPLASSDGDDATALSPRHGKDGAVKEPKSGRGGGLPPLAMARVGSSKDLGLASARRLMLSSKAPDDPPLDRGSDVTQAIEGGAKQAAVPAKPSHLPSLPLSDIRAEQSDSVASPRSALRLQRVDDLAPVKGRRQTAVTHKHQDSKDCEEDEAGQAEAGTAVAANGA